MHLRQLLPVTARGLALTLLVAPSLAQGDAERVLPTPPSDSRVVVTIDGEPIPAAVYCTWLMQHRGELMADTYAKSWLVEREAQRRGLGVTNEEIDAAIENLLNERINSTFGGDRAAWIRSLQRVGRSELGMQKQRYLEGRYDMLALAMAGLSRVVPHEKIVRDWERDFGQDGIRIWVRSIEFPVVPPPIPIEATEAEINALMSRAKEELREEVLRVRQGLLAGDDLAAVAKSRGSKPSAAAPGGIRVQQAEWPDEVVMQLRSMQPGELSEPIFRSDRFYLMRLERVVHTPFEDVEEDLRARLEAAGPESDEINRYVADLLEAAQVQVLPSMWSAPAPGQLGRDPEEIVLLIDGTPIRRAEYQLWLIHYLGEQTVSRFVDYWAIEKVASEKGVAEVDPVLLEQRVDESFELSVEYEHNGKRDEWEGGILSTGRSLEGYRRETRLRLHRNLQAERLILASRVVHPGELEGAWLDRYGPEGRLVDVSLIQLDTPLPSASQTDESSEDASGRSRGRVDEGSRGGGDDEPVDGDASQATLARLVALRQRALAGEDFGALADEYSDRTKTEDGGRLPRGLRPEEWPNYVQDEVLALEPGGISEPLQIGSSWLLFRLNEVKVYPFEEVEEELRTELLTRRPNEIELAAFINVNTRERRVKILPALFAEGS